jgi:hypothetical protein
VSKVNYAERLQPVIDEIARRSLVADNFIDKDLYRVYFATLWANLVMDPADSGLAEADLEPIYHYLNDNAITPVLGTDQSITECFRFINSKAGEQAMDRCQLSKTHRDLLTYFCSMILDPDGHRKWADQHRDDLDF